MRHAPLPGGRHGVRSWPLVLLAGVVALAQQGCGGAEGLSQKTGASSSAAVLSSHGRLWSVRGELVISRYGGPDGGPAREDPTVHRTRFVNGRGYEGFEDVDLRGYLDGRFKWGWNQPGQVHVRLGRRATSPRYGEWELFRVIQKWSDIDLPPGARVEDARLSLHVETPPPDSVLLFLYEVKHDWHSGHGGTLENNVSPPESGEVWWNDRAFGDEPWGLPGAGYASDADSGADTGAMPLAEVRLGPRDSLLTLSSPRLASYVERRIRADRPLLFLLKLDDRSEDRPGTMMEIYSGSHGDSGNPVRRPELTLRWTAPGEIAGEERFVHLEPGRDVRLPVVGEGDAGWIAATFRPDSGFDVPLVQVRDTSGTAAGGWQTLRQPRPVDGGVDEIRVLAARNPVALNDTFSATLRDTWIRSAAPEKQVVPWTFVSPSGRVVRETADYVGDYTWRIRLSPREPGRWRYQWVNRFAGDPDTSAIGTFDVIAADTEGVRQSLDWLARSAEEARASSDTARLRTLMETFLHLERAAVSLQTPETFRSEAFSPLRTRLDRIRSILGGEPMPDSIPMVPSPPADWER